MHDTRPRHTCGGCTNTWTGLAQCHCAANCHQTFGSITGFDRHRSNGQCRPPEDVGLAIGARGVWSEPFSWQREGEHGQDVLDAFAHQHHRGPFDPPTDEERAADQHDIDNGTIPVKRINISRPTHDDVTAISELGSDEYNPWLRHGHEDTYGPEQ